MNPFSDGGNGPIWPVCPEGGVCVVFSADANYAPYLAAALASLAGTASSGNFYDVIVLASDIGPKEQEKIRAALGGAANISLRFFDVKGIVERRAGDFFINAHITPATYYRLFTPSIFEKFDKILYLDGDIIILDDVARLYGEDLKGRAAGVARDFFALRDLAGKRAAAWARQLAMRDTSLYFNAGVLLLNLAKLRAGNYEERWFERLRAVKRPRLHDQDILNHSLEGETIQLDAAWNSPAWLESLGERIQPGDMAGALYAEYMEAVISPKIVHYMTRHKPWDLPHLPLAALFWEAAAKTPYYQGLVFKNMQKLNAESDVFTGLLRFPPVSLKYFFYSLMARLAPGEKGARFLAKAYRIRKMNRGLKPLLRSWH